MKERYIQQKTLVVLNKIVDQSEWLKDSVICLDDFMDLLPASINSQMMQYKKDGDRYN